MNQLVKYEAACRALAECKSVDEAKGWADKAAAMQAYGRMAKDKTLEVDAAEIRIRAERRLGEMLAATKTEGGLKPAATLKRGPVVVSKDHGKMQPTLSDAGISKDLSSRAQKLAAVPEHEFESEVGEWRDRVNQEGRRVSARLQAAGEREQKKAKPAPVSDRDAHELEEAAVAINELAAENEQLRDRLAVEAMDASEDEKTAAAQTIAELRHQIRALEAELAATRASRDGYQRQNSELMKQVQIQQRQLKKAA